MQLPITAWFLVGVFVSAGVGFWIRSYIARIGAGRSEQEAKKIIDTAHETARHIEKEAQYAARQIGEDARRAVEKTQTQLAQAQEAVAASALVLDKKIIALEEKERALEHASKKMAEHEQMLQAREHEHREQLEKIAGLTTTQAKEELLKQTRQFHQEDLSLTLQKLFKERKEEIEKKASEIITTALQRYARTHVADTTTSFFPLKDEDLKGKIIGREGRNIKAIERATGVELIIDETPDSIMISSFDPARREIAYAALEKLIKDGRIQPARIEEKVEEARVELANRMMSIGEAAATEVGVFDLPKELVQLLGRLHFRTSFGQNVLTHSIEMAHVAGMIAAELGLNVYVAKKGALLHDIGKAIDHEVEGTHVDLGRKLLKKYGVEEEIIWAMQSHHDDYPYASPESYIVTAADILSAGRPGARRGTVENYIKRLADLERIAGDFNGVRQAYAISAGRELRVFVVPEKIDDFRALEMAREIANRIQSELKYPGEIKVNVIRELRAVEYAR